VVWSGRFVRSVKWIINGVSPKVSPKGGEILHLKNIECFLFLLFYFIFYILILILIFDGGGINGKFNNYVCQDNNFF
jgi:hypothetical protein